MRYIKMIRSSAMARMFVLVPVCCLLLADLANGQAGPARSEKASESNEADRVAEMIEKAKQDTPSSIYYVVQIADSGAVQALPMLEEKFAHAKSELTVAKIESASVSVGDVDKANIACALVRLGDKKDLYFDFLMMQATIALEGDPPEYLSYDDQGKAGPGPSLESVDWARSHNLPPAAIEEEELLIRPAEVALLGRSGDPRAIPLLRRALRSRNYQIVIAAAKGLAAIQDKDSIPVIMDACKRAPAGAAAAIAAASLVYFENPEARAGAETYIPRNRLDALRLNGRVPGTDPFR